MQDSQALEECYVVGHGAATQHQCSSKRWLEGRNSCRAVCSPNKVGGLHNCALVDVSVCFCRVGCSRSPRVQHPVRVPAPLVRTELCIPRQLFADRTPVGVGPRAALHTLHVAEMSTDVRLQWLEEARVNAVLGSCKHSLKSLRSGFSCYAAFVRLADPLGEAIPPKLDLLLSWSTLFRSERTLANYLGYVKTACLLCGASVAVFDSDALKRAKNSVAKSQRFTRRPKLWIQRARVQEILEWCAGKERYPLFGVLFLFAYAFLLRLPSEALPVTAGKGSGPCALYREGDKMILELERRKNVPTGSKLVRGCWCKESPATCPLHILDPLVASCAFGQRVFDVSPASALGVLREVLSEMGIDQAENYRTHDLRRGHAQDLVDSGMYCNFFCMLGCFGRGAMFAGATLAVILAAGEWKSPAFLSYIDQAKLETDVVVAAHVDESDCEDV